jgi:hypothetical protein
LVAFEIERGASQPLHQKADSSAASKRSEMHISRRNVI